MKSFYKIYGLLITLFFLNLYAPLHAQESRTALSAFSITRMENQVKIDWVVDKKASASTYEVQRASQDHIFQTIAIIDGKENSQHSNSYETIDENPPAGLVQYRIKRKGQHSTVQVYEILSLDMESKGESMQIAKLVSDKQQLSFHLINPTATALQIQLTSLSGQIIAERKAGSGQMDLDITFPLSSVSSGMYVVCVRNQAGDLVKEKFLY